MAAPKTNKKAFTNPSRLKKDVTLDYREYEEAPIAYLSEVIYSAITYHAHSNQLKSMFVFAPVPMGAPELSQEQPYAFVTESDGRFVPGVNVLKGCDDDSKGLYAMNKYGGTVDAFYALRSIRLRLDLPGLCFSGFSVNTCHTDSKSPYACSEIVREICKSVKAYISAIKQLYAEGKLPNLTQYENTPYYLDKRLVERYLWDIKTIDLSKLYILGALQHPKTKSFVLVLGISRD